MKLTDFKEKYEKLRSYIEKIYKRIAVLERKSETRTGDLVWRNNVFGGEVEWMDNPNGRFEKAIDPQITE